MHVVTTNSKNAARFIALLAPCKSPALYAARCRSGDHRLRQNLERDFPVQCCIA
jgi:hypothetical protein